MTFAKKMILVAGLATLQGGLAWGGLKGTGLGVRITRSFTNTMVSGSMGGARNSADANQYIGCEVSGGATVGVATCVAQDASGSYAACYTRDTNMATAARAISGDSYLSFQFGLDGKCTDIRVNNRSDFEPKGP